MANSVDAIDGLPAEMNVDTTSQYDWDATEPTTAVVWTLADALDQEPERIGHLYEHLDADALDAIIRTDASSPKTTSVSFTVSCYEVYVDSTGCVTVETVPPNRR